MTIEFVDVPPIINVEADINPVLQHMSDSGGSDLFVRPGVPLIANIYGKKKKLTARSLTPNEPENILRALAGDAAPAQINSAKPVNSAHEFTVRSTDDNGRPEKRRYRYRLNAVGCTAKGRDAIVLTLRTIPTTPPRPSDVGMEQEILDVFTASDQGLILICGATGNGKSTLLAAAIRALLEDPDGHRNIVTIEEPIEFVYDDIDIPSGLITQIPVGRKIASFHDGVVNAMRMAPTHILVGEARDYETVSAAVEGSVTGHVVFSTVHSNSVAETFQRLVSVYPDELQAAARIDIVQAVKMIVVQRLVPSADGKRQAIREILVLDQEIRQRIFEAKNIGQAAFEMVSKHGRPMVEDARIKFEEGRITSEVYERVQANYASMKSSMGAA